MRFFRFCFVGFHLFVPVLFAQSMAPEPTVTEEIPMERCDRLPVVRVSVDGKEKRFLVDTAATSMLNLHSFPQANAKETKRAVSSWSGTVVAIAREMVLGELVLGSYRLKGIKLPALDLSAIAEACGGPIDGILGVDLLERMGATLDLKRRVALLPSEPTDALQQMRLVEYRAYNRACLEAANRADVEYLEGCFDPHVVLYTPWGEMRGRREVLDYIRRSYFSLDPPARFDFHQRDLRVLPDMAWYGYDYTIKLPDGLIEARGTAMCHRVDGRWQMVFMHNSLAQKDEFQQP